ncbi:dihydrolipoamide acetyltransferase family protein [Nocardioides insulae]|uniref:dihydrolipoamide acetyltransferase family protein n=1 Tax=Nocardioides insulae TaxID=394734 RepID=UPI00048C0397|nr:dihydrolipoamide acetyltransferase family protein [Nocardioides insulae]
MDTANPGAAQEFRLPDVGEGLTEATLVSWQVSVGEEVSVNDVLCEIETAKSVVELPSPYAGTVLALLVEVDDTVEVGTPIIRIGDPTATPPEAVGADVVSTEVPTPPEQPTSAFSPAEAAEPAGPAPAGGAVEASEPPQQTLVGYGPKEQAVSRRPRHSTSPGSATSAPPTSAVGESGGESGGAGVPRPLAKPPVRGLAKELGVDLATVTPTGSRGEVTRDDLAAATSPSTEEALVTGPAAGSARPPAAAFGGGDRREPVKGVRKMMSEAMVSSAFSIPHVTIWTTVDVTGATSLVEQWKGRREFEGVRVSPLLVLAKAVGLALRRTPVLNSFYDADADEVVIRGELNLGIAAATPRGLLVPNIKSADAMGLVELGRAITDLVAVAREGRTQPADQADGTFTITNVGPFGMEGGTPIINPGESAILCFGAIERRPWVVGEGEEERIVPRDVCTLALSFDHRHIDGQTGSRFLADVAGIMADPATALFF